MNPPPLTVAVPTCNGTRHLRAALQSILRSGTPHDLLIVDDRSDDDTVNLAREIVGDRGQVVVNSERLGLANNWNRCVSLSRTPLVAIFHQDDVMLSGHLTGHLAAFAKHPSFGWVASNAEVIDNGGQPVPETVVERGGLGRSDIDFPPGLGVDALATHNPIRCSAVTISRSAHAEVGGFDPSYRYVVDWDFWVRVAQVRPVAWRPQASTAIRWHPSSETHRFATGLEDLRETARLLDRIAEMNRPGFDPSSGWRRTASARLARAYLNRAHVAFKVRNLGLARRALNEAFRLAPGRMIQTIAADPRLFAQMVAVVLTTRWVERSRSA